MDRIIAIGASWPQEMRDRLQAALPDWSVRTGVASDPEAARAATVLVPCATKVGHDLLAGSRVRLVQQFGVGVDSIDLKAAAALGIPVTNAPSEASGMAGTVAEAAILLLLSCARLPSFRQKNLAEARWSWTVPFNIGLEGKTAGIVGLGSIGNAVARRLAPFGMRLLGVKRSAPRPGESEGFDWVGAIEDIGRLATESDFVVICAPLTPQTRGLFGTELLVRMKRRASLVNVGRGGIVDEAALLGLLDSGHLHAAGLDTVAQEPLPQDSPLLTHPRVVLTPHDAGASDVVLDGLLAIIADNVRRLETSEPLQFRVT